MIKHKKHQPTFLRSNVIYKLTCSCDSVYIKQTLRNLRARLDDHNPAANSNQQYDVAKHLKTLHILLTLTNQKFHVLRIISNNY